MNNEETERALRRRCAYHEARVEAWTEEDEKSFRQREKALAEKFSDHAPTEAEQVERVDLIALAIMRKIVLKKQNTPL